MAKPWQVQTWMPQGAAGFSQEISSLSYITFLRDNAYVNDNIFGLGVPYPTIDVGQYPFTPGFNYYDAADDTLRLYRALRKKRDAAVGSTLLGTPNSMVAPPIPIVGVDVPFFYQPELGTSYKDVKKKKWGQYYAGEGFWEAHGLSTSFIPAGTYSKMSCDLLSEIQRHFLEPVIDGGNTWSLWTVNEVVRFLNERLARFLIETGIIQTMAVLNLTPAPDNVYRFPSDLQLVRRLSIVGGNKLLRIDPQQLDNGYPGWESQTNATPFAYVEEPQDPLSFRLVYPLSGAISLRLFYTAQPPTITSTCTNLPLPAAFTPAIKWGIMADMLSKQGEANDPQRATLCESRFDEGVQLAKTLFSLGEG